MGTLTSEPWANAGTPDFPFQLIPGVFIKQGIVAPYSVADHDTGIFFVSQNKDGKGIILQCQGYRMTRVSTPAIEAELATYPTLTDAVGFCYSLLGHVYYVVSFPSADKTWSFDVSQHPPVPHEWSWIDGDGLEHRHRAQVGTAAYGMNLVGDWENGTLYRSRSGDIYGLRRADRLSPRLSASCGWWARCGVYAIPGRGRSRPDIAERRECLDAL